MTPIRAGIVTTAVLLGLPLAAAAQPADDDESGELAPPDEDEGGTIHESNEVIGPDGTEIIEPPPEADPPEDKPAKVGGSAGYDKGFFVKSDDGKFALAIKGRVQPHLALTRAKTPAADWTGAFEVRRARLSLEGKLHGDDLKYKVQTDFGRGNPSLKDFYADARLSGNTWIRVGQWKRPFSRQQITSSGKLEMADRAITDKAFGAGRDIGLALHNGYEDSPEIEWALGVWNGTGDAARISVDVDPMTGEGSGTVGNVPLEFRPAFIGRIGINSGGVKGYSEADLEGGPLRWGAAASFWGEGDFDRDDASNDRVELDFVVKAQGFSATGGAYAMTRQVGTHVLSDQELAYVGFHVQTGYMLKPKRWAATARFALVDGRADDLVDTKELAVGGAFYGWGHDAKVYGNVRLLKVGEGKFSDAILIDLGTNVGF